MDPDRLGYLLNRYGSYHRDPHGYLFGLTAYLRIAMTRMLDGLQLKLEGPRLPWLRQWAELDCLTYEEIEAAYPADHWVRKLDLSALLEIKDGEKFTGAFFKCLKKNFRKCPVYIRPEVTLFPDTQSQIEWDNVSSVLSRIIDKRSSKFRTLPPFGLSDGALEGHQTSLYHVEIEKQLKGNAKASYWRLVLAPELASPNTCQEGGSRGKI